MYYIVLTLSLGITPGVLGDHVVLGNKWSWPHTRQALPPLDCLRPVLRSCFWGNWGDSWRLRLFLLSDFTVATTGLSGSLHTAPWPGSLLLDPFAIIPRPLPLFHPCHSLSSPLPRFLPSLWAKTQVEPPLLGKLLYFWFLVPESV